MSLQELKSLSRQIRPLSASDASFTSKLNSRALSARSSYSEQDDSKKNIMMLSRCLRENMHRAKARMMNSLKNSNAPQDIQIYKNLINKSANYYHGIATPDLGSSDDEDDCSSVSTLSSLQFRLVTSDSGKISAVLSEPSLSQSTSFLSQDENKSCPFVPLYTPTCLSPSLADIDLFLQHSWPVIEKGSHTNRDVTEDQINSWLQRGGYNDSMSPITMATDQELADLLDFDL
ncbi:hypothetical protein BD560DRAFT_438870 [Blakeslea trispora]|nr:hypothetical protein BD560DRAFT_438870 [Blakeslea trispora]